MFCFEGFCADSLIKIQQHMCAQIQIFQFLSQLVLLELTKPIMNLDCSLCRLGYDSRKRTPMILCNQQHIYCEQCVDRLFKTTPKCPQCRQLITKQKVVKFRLFYVLQQTLQKQRQLFSKQNQQQKIKQMQQMKLLKAQYDNTILKYRQIIAKLIGWNKSIDRQYYQIIKFQAQKLIQEQNYDISSILLENIILRYSNQSQFVGIGFKQEISTSIEYPLNWLKWKYNIPAFGAQDTLAFVYMQNPNYDAQKAFYQRALDKDPNNYKLLFGLALTYHNAGKLNKAVNIYYRVIQIKPDIPRVYQLTIECYLKLEEYSLVYSLAIKRQTKIKSTKQQTQSYEYHLHTGKIYKNLKQQSNAIICFEKCLKIDPYNIKAYQQLASIYLKFNKVETALDIYKSFVALKFNAQIYAKIIEIYKDNKDKANILQWLKKWLQIQPDNIKIQAYLADYYLQARQLEKSLECCNICINQNYQTNKYYAKSKLIQGMLRNTNSSFKKND